jgi:hypothetical protein
LPLWRNRRARPGTVPSGIKWSDLPVGKLNVEISRRRIPSSRPPGASVLGTEPFGRRFWEAPGKQRSAVWRCLVPPMDRKAPSHLVQISAPCNLLPARARCRGEGGIGHADREVFEEQSAQRRQAHRRIGPRRSALRKRANVSIAGARSASRSGTEQPPPPVR